MTDDIPLSIGQRTRQTRRKLVDLFPQCFMPRRKVKRPLKINIIEDIIWRAPFLSRADVILSLKDYCVGETYQSTLTAGALRYDLDGKPAGRVSDKAASVAAHKLARQRAKSSRQVAGRVPAGAAGQSPGTRAEA